MGNYILQINYFCKNKDYKTFFRTMKIITLFLFIGLSSIFAKDVYSQKAKVNLSHKHAQLEKVLNEIEQKTNYLFVYKEDVNVDKIVSVDVKGKPVSSVLDELFNDTNISYVMEGNHIILSVNANEALKNTNTQQQNTKNIKGVIKDKGGEPLIGVSVAIKGTTTGTITDIDGTYSINVPEGSILVYSYVGHVPQEIKVGTRNVIDVVMLENEVVLDDVVVTALGIKRETKALTYNVQQITADEISAVKDANVMANLSGKIAGVNITQSASGMGGSTRVVMRGAKSLFGNNDALYVLDGIPMAAMKTKQSDNFYESSPQGDSEGISMINSDDIESISVLTGAAAAALYGSQGANGVVLITTKKGHVGKPRVTYSNNTTFSSPFVMPEFQNTYGRSGETYYSWGNKLSTPSSYKPEDFFQTGTATINTLSLSTGSESSTLHASVSATNSEGITPNSKYERYNFSLRSSSELIKDKLTMDIGVSYITQKDRNPLLQGLYYNPLVAVYLFPPGDDFNRFVPYKRWDAGLGYDVHNWSYKDEWLEGTRQNPLWIAHKNVFDNKRDKLLLTGTMKYNITNWLNISGRARIDRANATFERKLYASTVELFAHSPLGNYSDYLMKNQNIYADILLNFDKTFGDFRVIANLGGSFNDEKSEYRGYKGPLISKENFFHPGNVNIEVKGKEEVHTRNNAWFGSAQLGYKSIAYVDVTGRIDYFSSMYGPLNTSPSVFNPSVGGTLVVSELLKVPQEIMPLWKLRASYSQVGNPPPPYLTTDPASYENGGMELSEHYPVNLKAEKTKAFEIGTDLKLFNNLIDLSLTYYNTNTYNQLFKYKLPPTTGYPYAYANAGKVNNYGIELTLGVNYKIGPVDWSGTIAYSLNRNEIKELLGEYVTDPVSGDQMLAPTYFEVANANNAYLMRLTKGGTMGDIYVNTLKKDKNGYIYVDPGTGQPVVDKENYVKVGEAAPKYNLSFRNKFTWKDVSLGFMLDARVGGVVVSSTQALMDQYGVSKASAKARDKGGININDGQISPETYYKVIGEGKAGSALSEYTYSATNLRLRELSLGYSIPPKWLNNKAHVSVSLIARNLWMLYCKAPFDPEITSNTGTYYQGYDYFMPPSQRNIGFGVNVTF